MFDIVLGLYSLPHKTVFLYLHVVLLEWHPSPDTAVGHQQVQQISPVNRLGNSSSNALGITYITWKRSITDILIHSLSTCGDSVDADTYNRGIFILSYFYFWIVLAIWWVSRSKFCCNAEPGFVDNTYQNRLFFQSARSPRAFFCQIVRIPKNPFSRLRL